MEPIARAGSRTSLAQIEHPIGFLSHGFLEKRNDLLLLHRFILGLFAATS